VASNASWFVRFPFALGQVFFENFSSAGSGKSLPLPTSKERACAWFLLTAEKCEGKQHVLANILRVFWVGKMKGKQINKQQQNV